MITHKVEIGYDMNSSLILSNVLNSPILFFFIGLIAVFIKSDLENPQPIPKLFSLYLLFAIGFKGGHELHESGLTLGIAIAVIAAVIVAAVIPIYSFFILRLKLDIYNAAAIAASYGSISAVTFLTATSFLTRVNVEFGGHMVAALALMESPAIIVGLLLVPIFANRHTNNDNRENEGFSWGEVLREACLNGSLRSQKSEVRSQKYYPIDESRGLKSGKHFFLSTDESGGLYPVDFWSVFLLVGSLLVGQLTSEQGWDSLKPFTGEMFYGVLTFFLLDMGLVAARRFQDLLKGGSFLIGFSVLMPILNALMGMAIAGLLQMTAKDALLPKIWV